MGAVDTTYTFTATDTITSAKMNNIIDQTTITTDAIIGNTLEVASGKLKVRAQGITSNELAASSVTATAITNGSISPVKLSSGGPNWTGTGAGGVFSVPQTGLEFGTGHTQDFGCFIDLHSAATPTDFETRILRDGGANGDFKIWNQGTGAITFGSSTNERMRISSAGNVGIGLVSYSSKLTILSSTSNATPESGPHGFAIQAGDGGKEINMGYDSSVDIGYINASKTGSLRPVVLQSRGGLVGIGKTNPATTLDVNGTVTATSFAGPLTGNVTGNASTATTATTATTVSNGAITAAKLNGAQGGNAPIFGVRAFVQFEGRNTNGNCTIRASGNVTSVARTAVGKYTVTFGAPMQSLYYAVTCSASSSNVARIACADRATATISSIEIETYTSAGAADDFTENSVMIIE